LATAGRDAEAKQAYVGLLRAEPKNAAALLELAALAAASGHRSAARTACRQAVALDPRDAIARVQLAHLLRDDGEFEPARDHYLAALAAAPGIAVAHQGLAWVFEALGNDALAASHRQLGFAGNAVVTRAYRGQGDATPLLLLVSARNGNIPLQGWIDDRHFALTAIYTEFYTPTQPLPPHALVVNAIGDAELCGEALAAAEAILARSTAPVINLPARVRETSRADNARRLRGTPGVITPKIQRLQRAAVPGPEKFDYPLLVRAPGFHTGQHFMRVEHSGAFAATIADIPGAEILAIQYLDARGADGMARKYRVMFIDGVAYPLHLAVSADWKVHYFSAAMAENARLREEERKFLTDMPTALGATAMAALNIINQTLGLDYAGIDFGLDPAGRLLVFEANATMAIVPPNPDPIWDYRRPPINRARDARTEMLKKRPLKR
jgi:hypothetical protein